MCLSFRPDTQVSSRGPQRMEIVGIWSPKEAGVVVMGVCSKAPGSVQAGDTCLDTLTCRTHQLFFAMHILGESPGVCVCGRGGMKKVSDFFSLDCRPLASALQCNLKRCCGL